MGAKTEGEKEERFHRGREVWYICIVYKEETGDTKAGKAGVEGDIEAPGWPYHRERLWQIFRTNKEYHWRSNNILVQIKSGKYGIGVGFTLKYIPVPRFQG